MTQTMIQVDGLGKRYQLQDSTIAYRTLRDELMSGLTAPLRLLRKLVNNDNDAPQPRVRDFWALRDVSFDVRQGEVLGIIGRNGSGKSTLLKMLSRITTPTSGRATVRGRVGSLLEVGTGFHFELSGRDNVFLNGALLGMRREEIRRKFDEIVEFSQIGDFLDTPVKYYSSGMYMRLAFSVAAHLESEILLVDEVLAVGDYDFQQKCIAKMRSLTRSGRTVLFVSHAMDSVRMLCDRALLISQGVMKAIGPTDEVIDQYLPKTELTTDGVVSWQNAEAGPGNEFIALASVATVSTDGTTQSKFALNEPIDVRIRFWNRKPNESYRIRIRLRDKNGSWVFSGENAYSASARPDPWVGRAYPVGLFESVCRLPPHMLNDQEYSVSVAIIPASAGEPQGVQLDEVLRFQVVDPAVETAGIVRFEGATRPKLSWHTSFMNAA